MVTVGGLRSLLVTGSDFRSVDSVYINDVESPSVYVLSPVQLLAQLPDSLQKYPSLNSVMVLSRRLTLSPSSVLRFRIGDTPGVASGILRLVQLFTKILLSAPGSNIFNPNIGGGLLRSVGVTFGREDGMKIRASVVVAVDQTAKQIVAIQSRNGTLPRDERLLAAKLVSATFSRASASLFISVEILNQTGLPATLSMEL